MVTTYFECSLSYIRLLLVKGIDINSVNLKDLCVVPCAMPEACRLFCLLRALKSVVSIVVGGNAMVMLQTSFCLSTSPVLLRLN